MSGVLLAEPMSPNMAAGSLTPSTRMALKRAALRRNSVTSSSGGSGILPDGYNNSNKSERPRLSRDGSSSLFSIPPPPPTPRSFTSLRLDGSGVFEFIPPPPPALSPQGDRMRSQSNSNVMSPSLSASKRYFAKVDEVVLRPVSKVSRKRWDSDAIHARGWDDEHAPTSDHFLLRAMLEAEQDPWRGRSLSLMSPVQMSAVVDGLYCTVKSVHFGLKYRMYPGDCVVCGVPRSGLNPVVQALESLRQGRPIPKPAELVESVPWLEGAYNESAVRGAVDVSRVLRTHLPLNVVLGGEITPASLARLSPSFRAVVVLRDPLDLRLSWFRHVRRIYNKASGTRMFDSHVDLESFTKIPRGAIRPSSAAHFAEEDDYEHFVMRAIKAYNQQGRSKRLTIIFYEELLSDPLAVVQKLAEHSGFGVDNRDLIHQIADMLRLSALHPDTGKRKGSSGQGRQAFLPRSCEWINSRWLDIVRPALRDYSSYVQLYERMTHRKYCFKEVTPRRPLVFKVPETAKFSTNVVPSERKRTSMLEKLGLRRGGSPKPIERPSNLSEHKIPVDPDDSDEEM